MRLRKSFFFKFHVTKVVTGLLKVTPFFGIFVNTSGICFS